MLFKPLRILQVVQTLDPSVGGVAPAVLSLSGGLARKGHRVDILTLDETDNAYMSHESDVTIYPVGAGLTSYQYSRSLARWLDEQGQNYDRVIVNGLWQYPGVAVRRRYANTPIPYYVFPHGMLDPWFKRTFPLKHIKKWLFWPWADYRVLRDAAAVIFTSDEEREQARKSFWLYRCRETVSPLGLERATPATPESIARFFAAFPGLKKKRILLFMGRLHPKKACDILIDGFAAAAGIAPDIYLVFAGPDQVGWEIILRNRAKQLGVASRVVFTGMLEGELKQAALATAEAFILPSHQENFGMSVVEALAATLPVLISNRINIWREIEIDGAGYVEDDNISGATRLIQRWLETSELKQQAMRLNAGECFARRYTIQKAADSLEAVLRNFVETK